MGEVFDFCFVDLRIEEGNHGVQFPGLRITGENFSIKELDNFFRLHGGLVLLHDGFRELFSSGENEWIIEGKKSLLWNSGFHSLGRVDIGVRKIEGVEFRRYILAVDKSVYCPS